MDDSYLDEPHRDILCVDLKSFYASVECVELGLDPLDTLLVVMSNADNSGGLILASSPKAKKELGISNVARKFDLPDHPDLIIVPPRMTLYIQRNLQINDILRTFAPDEDLYIYSIDESFLDVTRSLKLFNTTAYGLAKMIKNKILNELGLSCTIGIGDNPLLAKLALDNQAKETTNGIAEWRYEDVPNTLWNIPSLTDFWGIGNRMAKRLNNMGIYTIKELAHYDHYLLKERLGIIGTQLRAHAWGIDRSRLDTPYLPKDKSYGNSQVLMKDYTNQREIEIVIREMAEQVATRIRRHGCQAGCISVSLGFSRSEIRGGFSRQRKIPLTSNSKALVAHCLELFRQHYTGETVRNIGITYSQLAHQSTIQFSLFEDPEDELLDQRLDQIVDLIRGKFGFRAIVHASSILEGATAIKRSSLVGGHAGGNDGLE